MIQYRDSIIELIINAEGTLSIRTVIVNSLQKMSENGTNPFIIVRFVDKLKTALNEREMEGASRQKQENIIQALKVLSDLDFKSTTTLKAK